ncbi:phosphotransferase enzyme family protein [Nocardiopsis alba]|uniref:phosphotransferase enzyme family protein n=1 Tax=Nocardiopsis alba TaxID=53437 RepID=UPI0035D63C2A
MPDDPHHTRLKAVLRSRYALSHLHLERLPSGQNTKNYRARCPGRDLFIKVYPIDSDIRAQTEAIACARLAGEHGVPTARVLESSDGEVLVHEGATTVSVWEWVDGHTQSRGFTDTQLVTAGQALGHIHTVFARHPRSRTASPWTREWFAPDLDGIRGRVDGLLQVIGERVQQDEFDVHAQVALAERRTMLAEVPRLLAGVPTDVTTQVLHGDYTAPNLLFDGDELAAVIDFLPPVPYMIAFELGRIAFDPRTVALDEQWIDSAAALIAAYVEANPRVARRDVLACGRVILIQMLTSLYRVEQHYRGTGLLQDDLDRFWRLRHRTARRLLENLEAVESMLDDIAPR